MSSCTYSNTCICISYAVASIFEINQAFFVAEFNDNIMVMDNSVCLFVCMHASDATKTLTLSKVQLLTFDCCIVLAYYFFPIKLSMALEKERIPLKKNKAFYLHSSVELHCVIFGSGLHHRQHDFLKSSSQLAF